MAARLEAPYEPLPEVPARTRAAIEEVALHANDRYLLEVIERYAFCPYAKEGRVAGETARFVYYAETASLEPLLDLMEETCRSNIVVTQIIFPLIEIDPARFVRFCVDLTALGHERMGELVLAVAPLHPSLEFGEDPHAMVPLFRRSPDPTIQWVRLDGLKALYEGREGDDEYIPPEEIGRYLEAHPKGKPRLYDRICETNAVMARRLGVEAVVEMLAEISSEARARYHRLLLEDES